METNDEMLQNSQTYDIINADVSSAQPCGIRCGARAFTPSSPNLLKLRLTSVTLLLTRKASARACRVGTTHVAKWTRSCCVMHCQLAFCGNPKRTTCWYGCFVGPTVWHSLRCPSLHALVAELVEAQVDFCHALVDAEGLSEGLQSWHDARGQVDSQLLRYALSTSILRKSQTYDMLVRMFRRPSRGIRCGARAFKPSSPNLLKARSTCVTLSLTRRASARACRVGTTHMAEWTAAAAFCIVN